MKKQTKPKLHWNYIVLCRKKHIIIVVESINQSRDEIEKNKAAITNVELRIHFFIIIIIIQVVCNFFLLFKCTIFFHLFKSTTFERCVIWFNVCVYVTITMMKHKFWINKFFFFLSEEMRKISSCLQLHHITINKITNDFNFSFVVDWSNCESKSYH